jgi:hypothetical protein
MLAIDGVEVVRALAHRGLRQGLKSCGGNHLLHNASDARM